MLWIVNLTEGSHEVHTKMHYAEILSSIESYHDVGLLNRHVFNTLHCAAAMTRSLYVRVCIHVNRHMNGHSICQTPRTFGGPSATGRAQTVETEKRTEAGALSRDLRLQSFPLILASSS